MRKINEIFYSLQGEGAHTGVPSVFVRFSGCNMRCGFCDTDHLAGKVMTDAEIISEVKSYPAEWIILTGGEPSLFIDEDFVTFLKESTGKKVAIETNGSCRVPENIDWVTVSPKTGMPGAGEYPIKATKADELKVVDLGQDLRQYHSLPCVGSDTRFYLQPCFVEDREERESNLRQTIDRVLNHPGWILSLQTHRLINIR